MDPKSQDYQNGWDDAGLVQSAEWQASGKEYMSPGEALAALEQEKALGSDDITRDWLEGYLKRWD